MIPSVPATAKQTPLRSTLELVDMAGHLGVAAWHRVQSRTLSQMGFAMIREARGLAGDSLRAIPSTVLDKAQAKPDPWHWLAVAFKSNPKLTTRQRPYYLKFFKAAASQNDALQRLAEIARGGATPYRSDLRDLKRARAAGDVAAMTRLNAKITLGLLLCEQTRAPLLREAEAGGYLGHVLEIERSYQKGLVRRRGATIAAQRLTPKAVKSLAVDGTTADKLATELVRYWLVGRTKDDPGYCFLTDRATANAIQCRLRLFFEDSLVATVRTRIKLRHGPPVYRDATKDKRGVLHYHRFGDLPVR